MVLFLLLQVCEGHIY